MSDRLYSFKELTKIGSQLYALGESGRKAATDLVNRTERLLAELPQEEREEWQRKALEWNGKDDE
jgi:hypothetical protein